MARTLVAHEEAVQKVFSDDYVFRIPDYQRPYSWTTEQARELIEDLLAYVQANAGPVAEMPAYFLGSIVLIKNDTPAADVVDGQQRLTTLTLLLSAVRANISTGLRGQITKRLYEEGDTFAGTADRFRLLIGFYRIIPGLLSIAIFLCQQPRLTIMIGQPASVRGQVALISLFNGAGSLLLALRNGRAFEREADATGVRLLENLGLRADGIAGFFQQMMEKQPADIAAAIGIWSSHPPTAERIAATRRPPTGTPAFSDRDWRALRDVCAGTN